MKKPTKIFYIFYPQNIGGVSEVCLSLQSGIEKNDYVAIPITSYKRAIIISIRNLFNTQTAYAITNLQYGFAGIFFKKSVFIIHGFPQRQHTGYFRYKTVSLFHKIFSSINSKTVAVSYLTKFASQNFYGINISSVIHNILPHSFFSTFKNYHLPPKQAYSIVFVGRVLKEKGVEKILESVAIVRKILKQEIHLHIIGDGSELSYLKNKYEYPFNFFYGYVSSEMKYKILSKCTSFISLHPAEPFGITALEASVLNVKCCLSAVGGHTEFVPHHLFFPIKDVTSIEEIASSIVSSFEDDYPSSEYISLNNENDYMKAYAMKYIKVLDNKCC